MPTVELIQGDCLERMKTLAPGSVDMVLCDPPYGTIENTPSTWKRDTSWDSALEPKTFFPLLNTLVRPNGAVVLFSQEPYTSRLITEAHGSIPFGYRMAWVKDRFANHLLAKKAPVSLFEDVAVFFKAFDSFLGHPLKPWFDEELAASNLTRKDAVRLWGSSASHYFTDGRQFMIPSAERLAQMQRDTGRFGRSYEELKAASDGFRGETRERFPKVFNIAPGQNVKTNLLRYAKDSGNYHPTQKPVALLADLVKTYTNEGDTVLDFTMGSGSTGVACVNTGRNFVGIERDANYFEIARKRISQAQAPAARAA